MFHSSILFNSYALRVHLLVIFYLENYTFYEFV